MQSGNKRKDWILEYTQTPGNRYVDPIMGWTSNKDMHQEIILSFPSLEQAEIYAQRHNLEYEVIKPQTRSLKKKSYASNFS